MDESYQLHRALTNGDMWTELTKYMWPGERRSTFGEYSDTSAAMIHRYESMIINKGVLVTNQPGTPQKSPIQTKWTIMVDEHNNSRLIPIDDSAVHGTYPLDLILPEGLILALQFKCVNVVRWLLKQCSAKDLYNVLKTKIPPVLHCVSALTDQKLAQILFSFGCVGQEDNYLHLSCSAARAKNFELASWLLTKFIEPTQTQLKPDNAFCLLPPDSLDHVICDLSLHMAPNILIPKLCEIYPVEIVIRSALSFVIATCMRSYMLTHAGIIFVIQMHDWIDANESTLVGLHGGDSADIISPINEMRTTIVKLYVRYGMLERLRSYPYIQEIKVHATRPGCCTGCNKIPDECNPRLHPQWFHPISQRLESMKYIDLAQYAVTDVYEPFMIKPDGTVPISRYPPLAILKWLNTLAAVQQNVVRIFTPGLMIDAALAGHLDVVQECYQYMRESICEEFFEFDEACILFDLLTVSIKSKNMEPSVQMRLVKWAMETSIDRGVLCEVDLDYLYQSALIDSPLLVIRYLFSVRRTIYPLNKIAISVNENIHKCAVDVLEWLGNAHPEEHDIIVRTCVKKINGHYPIHISSGDTLLSSGDTLLSSGDTLKHFQWLMKINSQLPRPNDNLYGAIMQYIVWHAPEHLDWLLKNTFIRMCDIKYILGELLTRNLVEEYYRISSEYFPKGVEIYNELIHSCNPKIPADLKLIYLTLSKEGKRDMFRQLCEDVDNAVVGSVLKARIVSWIYHKHRENHEKIKFYPFEISTLQDIDDAH